MSDLEAEMPDLTYGRGELSAATYGSWGADNVEKVVVQQTAESGVSVEVMPGGRERGLCGRRGTEFDHVFPLECLRWGHKPKGHNNRGGFCFYCVRAHA
ncbi:unnamed protein product, partial [Prorocentrum cordatum]